MLVDKFNKPDRIGACGKAGNPLESALLKISEFGCGAIVASLLKFVGVTFNSRGANVLSLPWPAVFVGNNNQKVLMRHAAGYGTAPSHFLMHWPWRYLLYHVMNRTIS